MHTLREYFVYLLACLATFLLTSCTTVKVPPRKDPCSQKVIRCGAAEVPQCEDNVEGQLLVAAKSIEHSLLTLAAAEEAENPPIIKTAPLVTPEGGMGGFADIDWTGPVKPLLERIACMSDYRVKVLGNEPPIPIIVSIHVKHNRVADILQNASFQTAKRAHILVFPESRVIELRYISL